MLLSNDKNLRFGIERLNPLFFFKTSRSFLQRRSDLILSRQPEPDQIRRADLQRKRATPRPAIRAKPFAISMPTIETLYALRKHDALNYRLSRFMSTDPGWQNGSD